MTDDLYYRKLESTSTSDLVDMLREKDGRIEELEKENAELREKLKDAEESREKCIAELKAVRPQWHDLRKDPNDLPKEDCEIITLHENGNKNIQKWKNGNWTNAIVIPVIAWCEIPKYEE